MSFFVTPSKEQLPRPNKSLSQAKNSDWICVMCNNLNFSFRKKCNRCKTQTRTQNEHHIASAYSHYYYENQNSSNSKPKSLFSDVTNLQTPLKHPHHSQQLIQIEQQQNLSKLAKKYCPQTKLSNAGSSSRKENFMNDYWEYINVGDFDQLCSGQKPEDSLGCEQQDDQLESLISKILIEDE